MGQMLRPSITDTRATTRRHVRDLKMTTHKGELSEDPLNSDEEAKRSPTAKKQFEESIDKVQPTAND